MVNPKENILILRERVAAVLRETGHSESSVKIVPATKTVAPDVISSLKDYGIFEVGENKAQELTEKFPQVEGIRWHFIGTLQTNKVKQIIDKVVLIHSLDRIPLADEIDRQALRRNITVDALIEVNIGGESAKSGVLEADLDALYNYVLLKNNIRLKGFMAVMPVDSDGKLYEKMATIFLRYKSENPQIDTLSMGMSGDFEQAVRHGSTLIRPGSILFGHRSGGAKQ